MLSLTAPFLFVQVKPTSIEQETFPAMVADRQLHAFELTGFWADVGQPKDFLSGTVLYLAHLRSIKSPLLADPATNPWVHGGNVIADPTAKVDPSAVVGPNVVLGESLHTPPWVTSTY